MEALAISESPSKEASFSTMCFCTSLAGPFVGYQMALDLGYLYKTWFHQNLLVDVGPGAVSEVAKIFPSYPIKEGGMQRSRRLQKSIVPYCYRLSDMATTCDEARNLRQVQTMLELPAIDASDAEYWGCEKRQLSDKERRFLAKLAIETRGGKKNPSPAPRMAPGWYEPLLLHPVVKTAMHGH